MAFFRPAAIAASLLLAPAAAAAGPGAGPGHESAPAPGQGLADYHAWLARSPEHRDAVRAFRSHLAARQVGEVLPMWQLIRTSSSWRQCAAERFEVAPADKWGNIVSTLKFVREEVMPAIGAVEALSVYRNQKLNGCSNGAPKSAHARFFALDLVPVSQDVTRTAMIRSICAAHGRIGQSYNAGLGFYTGTRFHVDSSGFRRWGSDGRGATSPCVTVA